MKKTIFVDIIIIMKKRSLLKINGKEFQMSYDGAICSKSVNSNRKPNWIKILFKKTSKKNFFDLLKILLLPCLITIVTLSLYFFP